MHRWHCNGKFSTPRGGGGALRPPSAIPCQSQLQWCTCSMACCCPHAPSSRCCPWCWLKTRGRLQRPQRAAVAAAAAAAAAMAAPAPCLRPWRPHWSRRQPPRPALWLRRPLRPPRRPAAASAASPPRWMPAPNSPLTKRWHSWRAGISRTPASTSHCSCPQASARLSPVPAPLPACRPCRRKRCTLASSLARHAHCWATQHFECALA